MEPSGVTKPKPKRRPPSTSDSARKLAAILIADAVGYSRLVGADERTALAAFKARHTAIEKAIARHRGRIFGGAGDSVVAEFSSAVDALQATLAFQAAIERLNADEPEERRMAFRAGINLGDVVVDGHNLLGEGINIAERLQSAAEPGGICLSGSVHEQVIGKIPLTFADLGELRLKNIGHAVRAYRVLRPGDPTPAVLRPPPTAVLRRTWTWAAALILFAIIVIGVIFAPQLIGRQDGTSPASGAPVIAVLPFTELGGDPTQAYFSEGVSQDIVSALGRFSNLSIVSSNAAKQIAADSANLTAAAKKLNVRYLVTGTIRQIGGRLRVTVDLADTEAERHLWGQQYDRQRADIFEVQDEITRNIVGALAIKVTQIEQERSAGKPTERLDAYDLLLRGRAHMAHDTAPELLAAREMFEKAIVLDPHYAEALAALGDSYYTEATSGFTEFAADALKRAEGLADSALEYSPDLTEAHRLLGLIFLARKEYDRGRREVERALELNASDAHSYATYGSILLWIGDAEGSIRALETALKFDPTLDQGYLFNLGFAYYLARRYDNAIETLEPIAGRRPGEFFGYVGLAASSAQLGRRADAKRAADQVRHDWPFFKIADFVDQFRSPVARQQFADGLRKAGLD